MDIVFKDKAGQRTKLELPCAAIVKRSPELEQRAAVSLVCGLLGLNPPKGRVKKGGSPDVVATQ